MYTQHKASQGFDALLPWNGFCPLSYKPSNDTSTALQTSLQESTPPLSVGATEARTLDKQAYVYLA